MSALNLWFFLKNDKCRKVVAVTAGKLVAVPGSERIAFIIPFLIHQIGRGKNLCFIHRIFFVT
jgi:hypothetical protein